MTKKRTYLFILFIVIIVAAILYFKDSTTAPKQDSAKSTNDTSQNKNTINTTNFNKTAHSTTDPNSIWVITNKQNPLTPKNYLPSDLVVPSVPLRVPGNDTMQLRQVAATALESMFAGAKQDGLNLMLSSGYRSYSYQVSLYGSYEKTDGQSAADKYSARPGYSEHQTGLAADVEPVSQKCEVDQCFGDTPEGKWLASNAYKYGFIIRYTKDKAAVTGYEYEPWHVRYVGIDLAQEMKNDNVETLEEFFNVSGGQNY